MKQESASEYRFFAPFPNPDKPETKPFHREGAKVAKEILKILN